MKEELSASQFLFLGIILTSSTLSNFAIAIRILQTNWKNYRPVHIYQVNYFTAFALADFSGLILVVSKVKDDPGQFCPSHVLNYLFVISKEIDIAVLQLDRLIAVSKPYFYKANVDINLSLKVVGLFKLLSIIITVVGSIIDPIFLYCPSCGRCNYVSSIYVYTVSYPALSAFLLTLAVSIYVSIMMNKCNAVQPTVVLPVAGQEINVIPLRENLEDSSEENNPTRISMERPRMINLGEIPSTSAIPIEVVCNQTDVVEGNEAINVVKMLTEIENKKSKDASDRNDQSIPKNESNAQTEARKAMLKKTLKMNLLTLSLLFTVVPRSILNIMFEDCNHLSGECDQYFHVMLVFSFLELCVGFLHPIVVIVWMVLEPNN